MSDLVLYEFESCPFCRKVRVMISSLGLSVEVRPCPKRGQRYRPEAARVGGKAQFPYLLGPGGLALYESDAILKYLAKRFGEDHVPVSLRLGPVTTLTGTATSLLRGASGTFARPSRPPPASLIELWSNESSDPSHSVRATLCELELPFMMHGVPDGTAGASPRLVDESCKVDLRDAHAAVKHLEATYAA